MGEAAISVVDRFVAAGTGMDPAQERSDTGTAARAVPAGGPFDGPPASPPAAAGPVRPAYQTDAPVLIPDGRATAELCHRPDPEDRFPVDWLRLAEDRYLVSVDWPAAHRFFAPPGGGRQDPMLVAETTRQATMMLAHAEYGVPIGDQFVMRELGYRVEAPDFTVAAASGAVDVVVECSAVQRRAGRLVGMRVDLRFQKHGRLLATSMGILFCTSARVYRRLRGDSMDAVGGPVALLPALAPHETGRVDHEDVVLAPAGRRPGWRLRLNTAHPTLFARPNDHVPGMVLLEAARQAATALTPAHDFLPAAMRVAFHQYCELAEPCWILAHHDTDAELGAVVRVEGVQRDEPVFTAFLGSRARDGR